MEELLMIVRQQGRMEMAQWVIDAFCALSRDHRDSMALVPREWRDGMVSCLEQLPKVALDGTRPAEPIQICA